MALTNAQYDAIIREYNQKQFQNKHDLDERIKEVYQRSDEFQKIDSEIAALSVSKARHILNGEAADITDLKQDIEKLTLKRARLLMQYGYPLDYLEMHYNCPDCQDTGYADNKKCHCFLKMAVDMLYTQSNLTEILKKENFDHFSYKYYSPEITNPSTGLNALETARQTVMASQRFIQNFDSSFENLFFYGDTGVGKTFLSNCIARELIDSCHSVLYFSAFDLFELFAKSVFSRGSSDHTNSYLFESDLLIIDDLGTELTNSFTSSQLFLCINERLLHKKSTIISTNLPIHTFAETYSERTFSRISSNYTMLKLIGDDIRIQKKLSPN